MIENRNFTLRIISSFFLILFFLFLTYSREIYFLIFSQIILFLLNWESLRMLEFKASGCNNSKNNNFLLTRCKLSKYDVVLILLINTYVLLYSLSFQYLQILLFLIILFYIYKIKIINIPKSLVLSYVCFSLICFIDLRQSLDFINIFIFIVFFTFLVDVSAYLVGSTLKGKKLAPQISPNKTLSGFFGGILIPVFFCILVYGKQNYFFDIICFSIAMAVVSQIGDLIESIFKRYCNVKDSSNLIPGHGGILDRMDSLLLLIIFVSLMKLLDYNFFFIV
ncbi:MAG: phosphatidate cytidylyltransferase [Alphaproteobacteria bacterium]